MILLLSAEARHVPAADCHTVGLFPCVALAQKDLDVSPLPRPCPTPCPAVCLSLQVMEPVAESQLPLALPQLTKSSGKSFFPAVPTASKRKPSLGVHAGTGSERQDGTLGLCQLLWPRVNPWKV